MPLCPSLVRDGTIAEIAGFGESLWPVFEFGQPIAELFLEADDERPAERVDGVAVDERAAVGAGLDFVLGDVRESDAGDPLVALRQGVAGSGR